MGKTAVFVIAVLHQLDLKKADPLQCLVLAHTRELAFQIQKEFDRLGRHIHGLRCELFVGGYPLQNQREVLKNKTPHVAVGTPGRVWDLVQSNHMNLEKLRFFILDECDKMLDNLGISKTHSEMRKDVQDIFYKTKPTKQVMMFSATFTPEVKDICRKFMRKVDN
jgi:ATP-dependent RNA helicase UAP56/SUB2